MTSLNQQNNNRDDQQIINSSDTQHLITDDIFTSTSSYMYRLENTIFNNNIDIDSSPNVNTTNNYEYKFSFRKLWKFTGPGFLMSVAYLDPGNLESDLQSGAIAGYKLLWTLLLSTLIGFALQLLAVRLGSTTGFHLAEICRKEYNPIARYFLWVMIEIAIICSDIQQVIGSALAINLLSFGYIPIWGAILITVADTFLFLLFENTGLRVLEAVFGVFISIMCITFFYIYVRVAPDQIEILKGIFTPWCSNCSYSEIKQLVGIVGSTVMPHNIYFHSTLVLSRNFDRRNEHAITEAIRYYTIESAIALFISFLCNLFITCSFAKAFYGTPEASTVSLTNAGKFIYDEYGLVTKIFWAIGLLAAGQCSTMTGTYAGQFVMEGFTKISLSKWKRILIIRSITIALAVPIALLALGSIDLLNFWCNVIQAIQLPFALLPILHFTASKRIMGQFRMNLFFQILCYLIAGCVIGVNIYIFINLIIQTKKVIFYVLLGILLGFYLVVLMYYLIGVNNVYRIGLFLRKLFCTPNAAEIDELLHASPVYTHPRKVLRPKNATPNSQYASFMSSNILNTSTNTQRQSVSVIRPEPVIA